MSKVDCSKVYVKTSSFSTKSNEFDGAFANTDIKNGELVETGIIRVLENFDGMKNPHVFTWSDEIPNKTWAFTSGCATYYNTAKRGNANTIMKRFFKENRFEIYAVRDIKKDEELTHTYKSLEWREVFSELNTILNQ